MFQYTIVRTQDDAYVTVYAPGRDPLPASSSHPNFDKIVGACEAATRGEDVSADEVVDLFDVAATVSRKFQRLSERVTVNADGIFLDGDPVHGTLQTQILDFLDAGEDFGPLVNFYEKLTTNPLGDVRDGLYDWIKGQTENGGKLTITGDGNVLGYKSMQSALPEWRTDEDRVWIPSRRGEGIVNGIDVGDSRFIEQVPGDVVEMPRSRVLHAPSQACGDGLHIGTYNYAQSFYGDTVMLVEFSPRDIVSLPDRASTWKLRVCRYTVIGPVDAPLDVPVFLTSAAEPEGDDGLAVGTRLVDQQGDKATIMESIDNDAYAIQWDDSGFGRNGYQEIGREDVGPGSGYYFSVLSEDESDPMDLTFEPGDRVRDEDGDEGVVVSGPNEYGDLKIDYDYDNEFFGVVYMPASEVTNLSRPHGKGGPTSQEAKGRGRNPAQDEKGRFSAGRPGSTRDPNTGRFA